MARVIPLPGFHSFVEFSACSTSGGNLAASSGLTESASCTTTLRSPTVSAIFSPVFENSVSCVCFTARRTTARNGAEATTRSIAPTITGRYAIRSWRIAIIWSESSVATRRAMAGSWRPSATRLANTPELKNVRAEYV